MSESAQNMVRNTGFFTFALIGQKVISFLYFTFLARTLGPVDIGRYVLALSITTIFSVVMDLGTASVLTREIAREPQSASNLFRSVLGFKIIMSVVAVVLVNIVAYLLNYPSVVRELIMLASVVMVLDSFILSIYSALRGFQVLTWESVGVVLFQITGGVFGLIISIISRDVRWFMGALASAVVVHFFYAWWQIKFRYQVRVSPKFNFMEWRTVAKLAWPFALAAILLRVYGYIDTVLLSVLGTESAVGYYSVAYKITFALQFIPTAFAASLFPGFSAYFKNAKEYLAHSFTAALVYLTAIAVPISWGIAVLAPHIIQSLYPKFESAVPSLQILMLSLPFLFATFPIGSLLAACDRQTRNVFNIGVATIVSVVANLVLIPRWGPIGAATASFLGTLTLIMVGVVVIKQIITINIKWLWSRLWRIISAGLLMALVASLLSNVVHFTIVILIASIVYTVGLLILGGITKQELIDFYQILKRKTN